MTLTPVIHLSNAYLAETMKTRLDAQLVTITPYMNEAINVINGKIINEDFTIRSDVEVFWFKKNIVHHYINLSFSIVFADGESRHIRRFNKKLTEFLKETYEYVSLSEIEFNEENATIFSLSLGDYDPYRNI